MTVTNQSLIQDESKRRQKNGNVCCVLSTHMLFENTKTYNTIKLHTTIVLPIVLYWWETCSLILSEENSLRIFEGRVLRRICGWKRE
jgi:hypothetical protein